MFEKGFLQDVRHVFQTGSNTRREENELKKKNWIQKLGTMLGAAIAAVMLSQAPVFAQEIICTENMTFQVSADKTVTEDFSAGPIMPGDTLKIQGKVESSTSGGTEYIQQIVAMDVAAYWYYPKKSVATGPFTGSFVQEYPSDYYKEGISNAQLNEILKGLEFTTTKVYNQKGEYKEVISGFLNNTGKIIRVSKNGEGPAFNKPGDSHNDLNEYDGNGHCVRSYNFRRASMYVMIYEPECDLTYDLDGGTLQGKTNPTSYTVAGRNPYSVKIWAPVKEGYHCTGMGTYDGKPYLFNIEYKTGQENGQNYFIHEYLPGYFGIYGSSGQNRDFRFYLNRGYTAVFHGNGGTVNGLDTWISEVDRIKDSTWPYQYTDVNFTPVRAGYQFEGWYLDENFSQKFYGFQDDRTYDTTGHIDWKTPFQNTRSTYITDLYAKWSGSDPIKPSATPTPTKAPQPTAAPQPTKAPQPTQAPQVTTAPQPTQTPAAKPLPKKNSQHKVNGLIYKVTASTASKKTVAVVKPVKKTAKTITIPASVKIGGYSYQVTQINAKAFRKNTRLRQVTIGSKVTKIGKQAFEGCKNLKKITLNTKVLKKIEPYAFRNIRKGAKIYVPKARYKAYKKFLKAAKVTRDIKVVRK